MQKTQLLTVTLSPNHTLKHKKSSMHADTHTPNSHTAADTLAAHDIDTGPYSHPGHRHAGHKQI